MNPERWQRIEQLFFEASEQPATQRQAWLRTASAGDEDLIAQVNQLLASDEESAGNFVNDKVAAALEDFDKTAHPVLVERRAGPYRLVREIGHGGMGTVYLGERADEEYKGEVAVKLLRPGFDTDFFLTRFRRERQTLARLQHPKIARLLDSGTTEDGMPYIVMEYIKGQVISDYCATNKLDFDARLKLFLQICAAVSHAHQRFVVHRDIKPSNILVDESGTPKLLDFGICKILVCEPTENTQTVTSAGSMMTPDYASPEQILGEPITVASDIYSLGAVLYELLSGERPHKIEKFTPQGIERAICDAETVRPSQVVRDRTISRRLDGDLDIIILHAMQKVPARRYASVEQFAADIENHLADRPIAARADTITYRARKFAARHRGPIAASVLLILSLSAGLAATSMESRRNAHNFALARSLASSLVFDVHDAIRSLPAATKARETVIKLGLKYLDALAAQSTADPSLQLELAGAYKRIGEVQGNVMASNLGNTPAALSSFEKALVLLAPLPDSKEKLLEQVTITRRLADLETYIKKPQEALATLERSEPSVEKLISLSNQTEDIRGESATYYLAISRAKRLLEDRVGAVESARKAQTVLVEPGGALPRSPKLVAVLSESYSSAGSGQMMLGKLPEALESFRNATRTADALVNQDSTNVEFQRQRMLAYGHLGDLLANPLYAGDGNAEGLEAYRTMLAAAQKLHEQDPADRRSQMDYGIASMRTGDITPDAPGKIALYGQSVDLLTAIASRDKANNQVRLNLAAAELKLGMALQGTQPRRSEAELRRGIEAVERGGTIDVNFSRIAVDLYRNLAVMLAKAGRSQEALSLAAKAVKLAFEVDPAKAKVANAYIPVPRGFQAQAEVHEALGHPAEASAWWAKTVDAWKHMEQLPGFTPRQAQEKKSAEAALAKLNPQAGKK